MCVCVRVYRSHVYRIHLIPIEVGYPIELIANPAWIPTFPRSYDRPRGEDVGRLVVDDLPTAKIWNFQFFEKN